MNKLRKHNFRKLTNTLTLNYYYYYYYERRTINQKNE